MKRRINISVEPDLLKKAKAHAKKVHGTTFSGLVTKLLLEALETNPGARDAVIAALMRDRSRASDQGAEHRGSRR